jgi:hypothetical protein
MKKNNLLIELNRVNELMGTKRLITEQGWVDDVLLKLIKISTKSQSKIPDLITALKNSQNIDEQSENLRKLINQARIEQNKEILNVIRVSLKESSELVYKQMIKRINNPKLSNAITRLKSEGNAENEIVDIMIEGTPLASTGDRLVDDLLADEYARRMRKKVKEVFQGPKPKSGVPVNFTKFFDDKVGKMIEAAKMVNEAANKISQGDLTGEEIINWKNTIKENMRIIFYEDKSIIDFMEREIKQGVSTNQPGFKKIQTLMDDLKKETTVSDMPWKSGVIAEKVTNKWAVFLQETAKASFSDWIWVYKSLGKIVNLSKRLSKIMDGTKKVLDAAASIDTGGAIQKANNDAKKALSGAVVLPNWQRQLNVTLLGSARGFPLPSNKQSAYDEIIKVFDKKPLIAARASFIIEKIIKIIKLTITLEVITTLINYFKFFSTNKKLQIEHGDCINELTNSFRVEGQDVQNMFIESRTSSGVNYSAATWVPNCFTKLLDNTNVSDKDINDIIIRSHYFSEDKGIIGRILDRMNIKEDTYKFIVSSRARLLIEISEMWDNIAQGQITGADSVIDELVSEINKIRTQIKPVDVTTSQSPNNTQPTDTTTVNKTKDEPSKTGFKDPFK